MQGMANESRRELFLVDGNSLAYRAFFALPETIATSKGMPTNAIFGFASMLVKILTDYGPKTTLVVWDAGMSGREHQYAGYKAHRPTRPDLLKEQWPHLEPLVEAFGYANIRVAGYEADDVIATLARKAHDSDIDVVIVTGDRDAFQLVEPGVKIMATSRGVTDTKLYDTQGVLDRYGVEPELIPDFIGLKGDSSDAIPGVPGIGEKTAAELLQRFGSLEGVLENVDEISGQKRRQNLVDHAEDARTSRRLAVALRDVEVDIDLDAYLVTKPDRSSLREVFRQFELREPLRRLEEALGEEEASDADREGLEVSVRCVETSVAELSSLGTDFSTLAVSLLTEDGTSRPAFSFAAYDGGEEVSVGVAESLEAVWMAWGDRSLVTHDYKTLASVSSGGGIGLCHDTMVAGYLLDPARRSYDLVDLAEQEGLGVTVSPPSDYDELAKRAVLTRALAERQTKELEDQSLCELFRDVELPLVEVLCEMENVGITLDVERLKTIQGRFGKQIAALEEHIYELAGEEFTLGSPQQLSRVLFDKLGLSRKRRGKTGFSTDARVLAAIRDEHPIVGQIEEWRELTKLTNTYLDALPGLIDTKTARLHTTFNQTATATGRLSSTNPNLQNIPVRTEVGREIRACFVAPQGCKLLSADYSQVELRVLAHIAKEEGLLEIFWRGEDVHAATAAEVFKVPSDQVDANLRSKAKAVNYGIVYGLSAYGLSDRMQIPLDEASDFIERYLDRFPNVRQFIQDAIARATTDGYVSTLFGRIRWIPELKARQYQTRQLGERLAVNAVVQGTAADIIKVAMVRCHDALKRGGFSTRLVLQIHDELLFETPEGELEEASTLILSQMQQAFPLEPPLAVDIGIGDNWLEAK
jgi:DNA polymerase I